MTQIATVLECSTRFTVLVQLDGHDAAAVTAWLPAMSVKADKARLHSA
ncbi:hypothetical protein ABZ923_14230 [Streptomyces sp. NPDC046881]